MRVEFEIDERELERIHVYSAVEVSGEPDSDPPVLEVVAVEDLPQPIKELIYHRALKLARAFDRPADWNGLEPLSDLQSDCRSDSSERKATMSQYIADINDVLEKLRDEFNCSGQTEGLAVAEHIESLHGIADDQEMERHEYIGLIIASMEEVKGFADRVLSAMQPYRSLLRRSR